MYINTKQLELLTFIPLNSTVEYFLKLFYYQKNNSAKSYIIKFAIKSIVSILNCTLKYLFVNIVFATNI